MSFNLALEFKGFTRFLNRAKNKLISWYGRHCDFDAGKIAIMASKEWDGMADLERKPFIKNNPDTNVYLRYLMQKRYNSQSNNTANSSSEENKSFHPNHARSHASDWYSLTEEERRRFLAMNPADMGMDHVIERRDKLHQMYAPRDLNILEYILKTRPRWPTSSRLWFLRTETKYIHSADVMKKWYDLTNEERNLYEKCAVLDSKRYALEKNAWVTKIIDIDLESDNFTLEDFELSEIRSRIESLGSIVELSKDLSSLISLRRPREPFSIFIEAYQYQIRKLRPEFKFGQHLDRKSVV